MNAILDSGRQKSLCSVEASNFLGLEKYSMSSTIVGLNGACISVRKGISAEISNGSSFKRKLNFLIVPKITGCVPTQPLDLTKIKLPQNIRYADAEFNIPKRIDILLGGLRIWLHCNRFHSKRTIELYYFCNFIQDQVDRNLTKFWDLEAIGIKAESSCHPDDSSKIPSSKVLGIPWDVVHDYFTIDVKGLLQLDTSKPITKRIVLQSAGKIYDPVGFLSTYTIRLKCLLQELWLRKLSWDDELPPDIHAVWSQWWLELPFLSELKIPRKIIDSSGDSSEVQIHTFSDASQKAYGAAAFLRVKHKDRVSVDLVTSKSRVAPLKRLSLPRLELMGALLAARLAKEVKKILDQKCSTRAFSGRTLRSPYIGSKVQAIDGNPLLRTGFAKSNPSPILTRGSTVPARTTQQIYLLEESA
ncbi:pro-Pol polyprotein [Trichonephila clavipes]|nr:pro-Pol polyprotein [Trichonephila clavipes]